MVRRRNRRRVFAQSIQALEGRVLFASTLTVNGAGGAQYTSLQTAMAAASAGDTILVSPGTYVAAPVPALGGQTTYWANKALTVRSTGGSASTILQVPSGTPAGIIITSSNVTFDGFTVNGGSFGVQVQDYVTLQGPVTTTTNQVIRNMVINPEISTNGGHGVLFEKVTNSLIENVDVKNASANGIFIHTGGNDIIKDCTVENTLTQHAFAIQDSDGNQLLDSTVTGSAFHGVILSNAKNNLIRGNTITNAKFDGITLSDNSTHTSSSTGNTIIDNIVNETGLAAGRSDGTAIFLNSESNYNHVAGNVLHGSVENGLAIFNSSHNLVEGNTIYDNGQGGIFVFNNPTTSLSNGAAPNGNVLARNDIYDNIANAGFNLRGSVNTTVEYNYVSGTGITTKQFGGLNTDAGTQGTLAHDNTFVDLEQGLTIDAASSGGTFYRNRFIRVNKEYGFAPSVTKFDGGARLGGNYYSNQSPAASGNPSSGATAYTKIIVNRNNGATGGGNIDLYPYGSESLGEAYAVTVEEPVAGTVLTAGERRELRWTSSGAVRVNISLSSASRSFSSVIATGTASNGVYLWTVPSGLAAADDYVVTITPANEAGTVMGTAGTSAALSAPAAAGATIALETQPRGDHVAPGSAQVVAWKGTNLGSVAVELSTDGSTWTTLGTAPSGKDFLAVTLPGTTSASARYRVRDVSTGAVDVMDGRFAISDSAAVTAGPAQGAQLGVGTRVPLAWTSPASSVTVNVALVSGGTTTPVVSGATDVGHFDAQVPDALASSAVFRVTYFNAAGAQVGSADSSSFAVVGADVTGAFTVSIPGVTFTPGTYQRNQSFSISATVANTGSVTSTAPTVSFYFSTDATIGNSDDILLGTGTGAAVAPGGTTVVALSPAALISAIPGGTYYVGATVNANGDANAGDNSYVYPAAAIGIPAAPAGSTTDLAIGNVNTTATAFATSQTLAATATVTNAGNVAAGGTVSFFLSSNATVGDSDDRLLGTVKLGSVKPGAPLTASLPKALLASIPAGTYFLGASIVAAGDSVGSNNAFVNPTAITITSPVLDLAGVSLAAKRPKVVIGTALAKEAATATFINSGQGPITATTNVTFFYSAASTLDESAVPIISVPVKLSKFAVGKKVSVKGAFSYATNVPDGSYYLFARINTQLGLSNEATADNNIVGSGLAPVTIQAPVVNLGLTTTSIPVSIVTGPKGKNSLVYTLANGGNVLAKGSYILQLYASDDQTFDGADTLLYTSKKTSLSLAAGKSSAVKIALKLAQSAVAGNKFVYAVITPTTTVPDTTAANNATFSAAPVTFT